MKQEYRVGVWNYIDIADLKRMDLIENKRNSRNEKRKNDIGQALENGTLSKVVWKSKLFISINQCSLTLSK